MAQPPLAEKERKYFHDGLQMRQDGASNRRSFFISLNDGKIWIECQALTWVGRRAVWGRVEIFVVRAGRSPRVIQQGDDSGRRLSVSVRRQKCFWVVVRRPENHHGRDAALLLALAQQPTALSARYRLLRRVITLSGLFAVVVFSRIPFPAGGKARRKIRRVGRRPLASRPAEFDE